MSLPTISLVTPVLNQVAFVEEAIRSILDQRYPHLEHVIVDGSSTDGTLETIERYKDRVTRTISEPDDGQYDALNKGFSKTTGEVMGWLNGDDLLLPGALHTIGAIFARFDEVDWLTGSHTSIPTQGWPLIVYEPIRWSRWHLLSPQVGRQIPQESTFWRRSLWEKAGAGFAPEVKLAGDFDLWARFSRHSAPTTVDALLGCFRFVEGQRSVTQAMAYEREVAHVRDREREMFPGDIMAARVAAVLLGRFQRPGRMRSRIDTFLNAPRPIHCEPSTGALIDTPPTRLGRLAEWTFRNVLMHRREVGDRDSSSLRGGRPSP